MSIREVKEKIEKYIPTTEVQAAEKKAILDYIESFPKTVLTRENLIAHLTSSSIIVSEDLKKVLMIYHKIYRSWSWTGGHCDGDSDLLAIAIKEAQEETGGANFTALSSDIQSVEILPVYSHIKNGTTVPCHLHLNTSFLLTLSSDTPLKINTDETEGVRWIDIDKLSDFVTEDYMMEVYSGLINKAIAIGKKNK